MRPRPVALALLLLAAVAAPAGSPHGVPHATASRGGPDPVVWGAPAGAQEAPRRVETADFAITPPPGWSALAAPDRALLFPAGSRPLDGPRADAPILYLRVVREPGVTVEGTVSRTGVRLFGRDPRRDEAPVLVRLPGEQLLTGQFFGGANDATSYRAFVGAIPVPRRPDTLLLVLAWAPEESWSAAARQMNQVLHTLVLLDQKEEVP